MADPTSNSTSDSQEVVITGLGVVSPIGVGRDAFQASLHAGRSGVRLISRFNATGFPVWIGAEVLESDFDPKAHIRPRKSLKVMSREIQFGFTAADMAMGEAGLAEGSVDPERLGVVFGADMIYCELDELESAFRRCMEGGEFQFDRWGEAAMSEMFPLWLLRNLPNMVACHVAIAFDGRGPCNTVCHSDVSGLTAIAEAVRVIQRGKADVMIAGGVGGRVHPTLMAYRGDADLSHRRDDPARAMRPFDAARDGLVNGEGSAAIVLESRSYAEKRGARILGRVLSLASGHTGSASEAGASSAAIGHVIAEALRRADLSAADLGHVNAHGLSTPQADRIEAQAIHDELGDIPVTAPSSYFGHLGAGSGAMCLAASMVGLAEGEIPATLNYETPDPQCPVNVIHQKPLATSNRTFLKLAASRLGQTAAIVIDASEK